MHAETRCRSVYVLGTELNRKTVENQDWATRPLGRRATAGHGGWWVVGGSGCRAAGLLLAKPYAVQVFL